MIKLEEVILSDAPNRAALLAFLDANYASELPLDDAALLSKRIVFFWALNGSGARVGVTGFMPKTPYLAESVKSVVAADFRGKGYGAALSLAIENEVRARGFKKIMSTILVSNLPMIFIKLKQGYVIEGTHYGHEKPGLDEYSLGKRLD